MPSTSSVLLPNCAKRMVTFCRSALPSAKPGRATDSAMTRAMRSSRVFFIIKCLLLFFLLRRSGERIEGHSFTAPRVMPLVKYFCRKGYTHMMGTMAQMMVAMRSAMGGGGWLPRLMAPLRT